MEIVEYTKNVTIYLVTKNMFALVNNHQSKHTILIVVLLSVFVASSILKILGSGIEYVLALNFLILLFD